MKSCEKCQYFYEGFDYDDWTGTVFDYCRCSLTNELIDTSEADYCEDYEELP